MLENIVKVGLIFIIVFILVSQLITLFPILAIKTTENGQHTGIVTAVETNGIIWRTNRVYFKTDVQSSQEDSYCIIDTYIKQKLEKYQINKQIVTIYYDDYFIVGRPLCKDENGIIIGVEEVK